MTSTDASRHSAALAAAARARRGGIPPLTIGRRFGIVAFLLTPLVASVCVIGALGAKRMNGEVTHLYRDEYTHTLEATRLSRALSAAEVAAVEMVLTDDAAVAARLGDRLDRRLLPAVDAELIRVRSSVGAAEGPRATEPLRQLAEDLRRFERLRAAHVPDGDKESDSKDRLALRASALFKRMRAQAETIVGDEAKEARSSYERTRGHYRSTLELLLAGSLIALFATLAVIAWLTRSIVPRARAYSKFAAEVAKGRTDRRLEPTHDDELTELGVLLNQMIDSREREQRRLDQQTEFSEAMQLTENEEEAYELLKHHLERSFGDAQVTVLSRNNSADRLEPRTPVPPGAPLERGLVGAKPRSCLAVRTGEQQTRTDEERPLIECAVCGNLGPSACQPLLVGGEVMGSVLALDGSLADDQLETMRMSVNQAAPVLANLRNLSIAEERARTDELTGLANQRSVNAAVKRLVAAASADAPLGVILIDLDRFKQINDVYGHAVGDEVLAAVGAALRSTLQADDFCGRWGGEEFIVLLPKTDASGARAAAEKLRAAIGRIRVAGVEREISASLGVAVFPLHGANAQSVLRGADRALYAAKAAGRNRVEVVMGGEDTSAGNGAASASAPTEDATVDQQATSDERAARPS